MLIKITPKSNFNGLMAPLWVDDDHHLQFHRMLIKIKPEIVKC